MKRITQIEFVNYKAFYDSGEDNIISIPDGRSVLIYGENGSGKSSIYEGLKQFFNSSDNTIEVTPSRHIAVAKTRLENEGTETQTEVLNEVSVKVTFDDESGLEKRVFGIPDNDVQDATYVSEANLLNSFLSYRELLQTYLMDDLRDRTEFRRKFANLIIEKILGKQINSVTQRSFAQSWESLFAPRAWYKEEKLEQFAQGLNKEIIQINLILNEILSYFEPNLKVELVFLEPYIDYIHSPKKERTGKHPICEIDLSVNLFGLETDNDEENHLTVLNEARLSALAISIYIASLVNTPQNHLDFKILYLDDIFIGLDMSNRLPLLEILKNFKKPIIEQFVDEENDNVIVDRIQKIDGQIQNESHPFFESYQIFISTYDRFWFQVAKNWFDAKSKGKWCYLELYANQKSGNLFNTPLLYNSLNYLQKAEFFYSKHDYPSCANHLRKALEQGIKNLLPSNEHFCEYVDNETGLSEIKKLRTLNQYLEKFIAYCDDNGINASELSDLKNLKDWYFNPFSHDNIGTPIFKRELVIAISLVKKLEQFNFQVLLEGGKTLFFEFDNGAGETRKYFIELQENLRWIKSENGSLLTNPKIICPKWIKNGITESKNWDGKILTFYNNKWRALIKQENIPDFSIEHLLDNIKCFESQKTLKELIELV